MIENFTKIGYFVKLNKNLFRIYIPSYSSFNLRITKTFLKDLIMNMLLDHNDENK